MAISEFLAYEDIKQESPCDTCAYRMPVRSVKITKEGEYVSDTEAIYCVDRDDVLFRKPELCERYKIDTYGYW